MNKEVIATIFNEEVCRNIKNVQGDAFRRGKSYTFVDASGTGIFKLGLFGRYEW